MDEAESLADRSTADALEVLRWDWAESYLIEIDDGEWRAKLGGWIEADSPDGLDLAIREDQAVRPVARDGRALR